MTIRNLDQHELRLIKFGLLRSDPQLVAMMNVFSRADRRPGHALLGADAHTGGPCP